MKLSKDRFEKARWFIRTHARRLDRLLYEFYFEKGSTEYVLNELANYQNPDGGFGHAIEPDIRLQASSPMATSVGLQYCVSMNTKAENQVMKSAIAYLLSTYDAQEEYWPQTLMNVNDEPHAPWWHLDELKPPEEQNWPNPSAELAGYLHRYSILVPSDFIEIVTERAKRNLESEEDIRDFYNVMNWQRAAPHLPEALKSKVKSKVESFFIKLHPLTREKLRELMIFKLAPSPHSILAQIFPETVDDLLDSEIENQAEDGGWWPTWNWRQYEDDWKIAKVEWAGKLTVECLHTLKNFLKITN